MTTEYPKAQKTGIYFFFTLSKVYLTLNQSHKTTLKNF